MPDALWPLTKRGTGTSGNPEIRSLRSETAAEPRRNAFHLSVHPPSPRPYTYTGCNRAEPNGANANGTVSVIGCGGTSFTSRDGPMSHQEPIHAGPGEYRGVRDTKKTIAAFAIDEHIRWASARVTDNDINWYSITFGQEVEKTEPGFIAEQVTEYVARVSKEHPDVRHAQGIGISMIGPVDVAKQEVRYVSRKDWKARKPGDPVIDFKKVFSRRTHELAYTDLVVQNDATCATLAEWFFRQDRRGDYSLWLYITINAGVNCGVVNVTRPLFQYRHPEMGHVFPAIHPNDPFDPEKHSGCPSHTWCFEGIASGDAMQKRWGDDWNSDERAWQLEAHYVAQLCLTAMLAFLPDRIGLGGYVVRKNPDFLPMVRAQFAALNKGYIQNDSVDNLATYISAGRFDDKVNALGALVLALGTIAG
jgi:fructokinase